MNEFIWMSAEGHLKVKRWAGHSISGPAIGCCRPRSQGSVRCWEVGGVSRPSTMAARRSRLADPVGHRRHAARRPGYGISELAVDDGRATYHDKQPPTLGDRRRCWPGNCITGSAVYCRRPADAGRRNMNIRHSVSTARTCMLISHVEF